MALAACATPPAYDLDGTRWQLEAMDGVTNPPASQLTFTDNEISGSGICNVYDGDYRLIGDRLVVTNIVKSPYFCGALIDGKDTRFFEALQSNPTLSIQDDQLTLASPSGPTLVFRAFQP